MKLKVFEDKSGTKKILEAKNIEELAKMLKIDLNNFIIVKNNELVTRDVKLQDNDEIKFLSVISGG